MLMLKLNGLYIRSLYAMRNHDFKVTWEIPLVDLKWGQGMYVPPFALEGGT